MGPRRGPSLRQKRQRVAPKGSTVPSAVARLGSRRYTSHGGGPADGALYSAVSAWPGCYTVPVQRRGPIDVIEVRGFHDGIDATEGRDSSVGGRARDGTGETGELLPTAPERTSSSPW